MPPTYQYLGQIKDVHLNHKKNLNVFFVEDLYKITSLLLFALYVSLEELNMYSYFDNSVLTFSSPEPKTAGELIRREGSVIRPHIQTTSPLKQPNH